MLARISSRVRWQFGSGGGGTTLAAPAPFAAGVAMDYVSPGVFSYQIGGSDWSTGTYAVTLRSPTNTKSFTLSVFG